MKCKVIDKVKGGYLVSVTAFVPGVERKGHGDPETWFRGDEFDAAIIDTNGDEVVLSRKRFVEQTAETLIHSLKVGHILDGVISNIQDYGVFVNIGPLDGLAHRKQNDLDHINKKDKVRVEVLSVDPSSQKISLKILNKDIRDFSKL